MIVKETFTGAVPSYTTVNRSYAYGVANKFATAGAFEDLFLEKLVGFLKKLKVPCELKDSFVYINGLPFGFRVGATVFYVYRPFSTATFFGDSTGLIYQNNYDFTFYLFGEPTSAFFLFVKSKGSKGTYTYSGMFFVPGKNIALDRKAVGIIGTSTVALTTHNVYVYNFDEDGNPLSGGPLGSTNNNTLSVAFQSITETNGFSNYPNRFPLRKVFATFYEFDDYMFPLGCGLSFGGGPDTSQTEVEMDGVKYFVSPVCLIKCTTEI